MNDLETLLQTLAGDQGWAVTLLVWMGTARAVLKILQPAIASFFQSAVAKVRATPETDDDDWVRAILSNRLYRLVAFILDWLLSIKLPAVADLAPTFSHENS